MEFIGFLGIPAPRPAPLVAQVVLFDDLLLAYLDLAAERRIRHDDVECAECDAIRWLPLHLSRCSNELAQKMPPLPSPMIAMYALVTLARNVSLSMPRKHRVAVSLRCCVQHGVRPSILFSFLLKRGPDSFESSDQESS